jgi:hypothetical protein
VTGNIQERAVQQPGAKAYQKPTLVKGPLLAKVTATAVISGVNPA